MSWQPVDERSGIWRAEKQTKQGWSICSHAVRLGDGASLVISPMRGSRDDAHAALAEIGAPKLFVAPNHFHHLGLPEHVARYTDAIAVAGDVAAPRVRKKSGVDIASLSAARSLLPDRVSILEPAGTKAGEVWVRVEGDDGVTWIVGDAFFHVPERPTGLIGWFLRRTKAAPGLCLGWTFLKLGLSDRVAYRRWLDAQLDADRPTRLIPSHGVPISGPDVTDRLRELARTRLPPA